MTTPLPEATEGYVVFRTGKVAPVEYLIQRTPAIWGHHTQAHLFSEVEARRIWGLKRKLDPNGGYGYAYSVRTTKE